jgi:prepilin-type N-terminal cleavage/methylation domain-containing protein
MIRTAKRRAALVRSTRHAGFTLVEMLVAVTVSLVIILAMVQVFQVIGDNVSSGRAILEMQGQLRVVSLRLQQDLEGVTVPVRPWPDSFAAQGYFEYVEGLGRDWDPNDWHNPLLLSGSLKKSVALANPTLGDYDDLMMFTTRSTDKPFLGQVNLQLLPNGSQPIESMMAEVGWWTTVEDQNGNGSADESEHVNIHRRAWLIRPDLNNSGTNAVAYLPNPSGTVPLDQLRDLLVAWLDANDISVRVEVEQLSAGGGRVKLIANSLADLTQRQNRMAHWGVVAEDNVEPPTTFAVPSPGFAFPYPIQQNPTVVTHNDLFATTARSSTSLQQLTLGDQRTNNLRLGEDVILSKALSFDIQAYDPTAPLRGDTGDATTATIALSPCDQGWYSVNTANNNLLGIGSYVDLGYERYTPSANVISTFFSSNPHVKSGLSLPTYCTWSLQYEKDGINQDGDTYTDANGNTQPLIDEGTDGIDNNGANGVDDLGERETSPPYPVPLRGVRVRIRLIEDDSRQVRQITVTSDFTPE